MQGTKLGPYEIVEQLGAGGMGEVWLAQDTRLGRKVAVKVLPEQFASDPDRLARFEQEARAAAALNHPNIAAVYDVGHEGATHFMVQEYLEGQSLRDLLDRGPLSTKKALALGTEIAEALRAAHRAGIVHRDLKPENLFVSPDGHAKVLDFGLAKLTEMATGPLNSQSMSPTVLGTQAGAIMGTAGYMAPEQVQGEEVDARADVFALGCVLWEMLTGTRAFAGKSVPHTLHKILDEAPEGHDSEAGRALPLRLRWLLDRTLAKSPEDRAQSAGDVAAELKQIAAEVESGRAITEQTATDPGTAETGTPPVAGLSMKAALPAAALLLLVGAALAWLLLRPAPAEPDLLWRFEVPYPDGTAIEQGNNRSIAISPDGSMIAFEADAQLWIRHVDDLEPTAIRNTEELRTPFFSPDGRQIGFWAGGQIKRVAVSGGAPVVIGPVSTAPLGASWAEDDFIYVGQGAEGIVRLPATGGPAEQVVELEEGLLAHGPQLLPGGDWLLFTLADSAGNWDAASIVAQSLTGGERRTLVSGGRDARATRTGHLLFGLDGVLFAQPFDASTVSVSGGPVSLVEGIRASNGNRTGSLQYHVNDRGDLIYVRGGAESSLVKTISWRDRSGNSMPLPFEPRDFRNVSLSADGTRVAVDIAEAGIANVWLYSVDRPGGQRLTQDGALFPVWSPDGVWVYFGSPGFSAASIWRRRADLSAPPELVLEADGRQLPVDISSDGSILLYAQLDDSGPDVAILRLGEEPLPEILVPGEANAFPQAISPDGRYVAFLSNESGRDEVYVVEVDSRRRWLISTAGGSWARWSPDGQTIYYTADGVLWSVAVSTEPDFTSEPPRQLFQAPMSFGQDYAVAPDNERLLWISAPTEGGSDSAPVRGERILVTLNWFEELQARVPSGR